MHGTKGKVDPPVEIPPPLPADLRNCSRAVQCTKGKCAKAFHVTCALQEGSGIFLDATVSDAEHGGEPVSILEQAKSPSATTASYAAAPSPAADEADGHAEAGSTTATSSSASAAQASNDFVQLTILCRTHNPVSRSADFWTLQASS